MKKSDKPGKVKKVVVWILCIVVAVLVLYPLLACLYYPSDYVFRALAWGESSVYDYLELPGRPLKAGAIPFYFARHLRVRSSDRRSG
jgi:hypothetical protein